MRKDWKALKLKIEKTQAWILTPFLGLVYFNKECDRRKDRERQRKKFSPGSMRTNTRLTWGLRAASKSASTPPYASPIKYMVLFGRTICSSFITASTCSNKAAKWFFTSSSSSSSWVWSQTLSQDDMILKFSSAAAHRSGNNLLYKSQVDKFPGEKCFWEPGDKFAEEKLYEVHSYLHRELDCRMEHADTAPWTAWNQFVKLQTTQQLTIDNQQFEVPSFLLCFGRWVPWT